MIYRTLRFSATEEEVYNKILQEAKKKKIDVRFISRVPKELGDNDVAAYYIRKKGISGNILSLLNKTKTGKEALEEKNMSPGKIHIPKKAGKDSFVLSHELGHALNEKSKNPLRRLPGSGITTLGIGAGSFISGYKASKSDSKEDKKKWDTIGGASIVAGNLTTPAEEWSASQRALKMMKKHGASKELLKDSKKYANQNTLVYLNPKEIKNNKFVRRAVLTPLAINTGLNLAGRITGKISKRRKKDD